MNEEEIIVDNNTLKVGGKIQYTESISDRGRNEEKYCFTGNIVCVDCRDDRIFCVKRDDGEKGGGCHDLWKVSYNLYKEYGQLIGQDGGKIERLKLSLYKKGYKI